VSGAAGTIGALLGAVRSGAVRLPRLTAEYLGRIELFDKEIGAFLHVMGESASDAADALQARLDRGEEPGPLAGAPIAIKDNIGVAGHPTTAASRILEGFVPIYTATAVERLRAAGAIVIGKTNLDEFAMGSSNEFSAFRPTRNPYDPERVPGGSSGGSAAAVAAGLALGALGTDTGGSVRQPAAFCGLVALKPEYGAVSRYGLLAFGSSLDQIGPMARTATDCARIFNAIAGPDPRDATRRAQVEPIDLGALDAAIAGLRLGVPSAWLVEGVDPEVRALFDRAGERFRTLGVELVPVELAEPSWCLATYAILANAEASSNLARYDGVRYGYRAPGAGRLAELYTRTRGDGFGPEVKRRILLGTFVLSAGYYEAYYAKAMRVRGRIRAAYDRALTQVDAILAPATPTPAFRLGEKLDDPVSMYLSDLFTVMANLTGRPAVAFPVGRTRAGLPVGAQLFGRSGSEGFLLRLVHRFTAGEPLALPERFAWEARP
jgi:aspartyl-tRNA(Asn)/glutamyl-tRNA(Gln) amidotransferase subunit A